MSRQVTHTHTTHTHTQHTHTHTHHTHTHFVLFTNVLVECNQRRNIIRYVILLTMKNTDNVKNMHKSPYVV